MKLDRRGHRLKTNLKISSRVIAAGIARLNTMEETADKGLELKGRDAANRNSRDIGRISVTGYDTGGCGESVERELKKIYASCGEITDVYIPRSRNSLWHYGVVYFLGEGAVDKALQLNGTDMGGWTLSAEEYPFSPEADRFASFVVEGYDTSLSVSDTKSELSKLFSSCGKIVDAIVFESPSYSLVILEGENIVETVLNLNGAQIGGSKIVIKLATHPEKSTSHPRQALIITGRPNKKKAKMTKTTKLFKKKEEG